MTVLDMSESTEQGKERFPQYVSIHTSAREDFRFLLNNAKNGLRPDFN